MIFKIKQNQIFKIQYNFMILIKLKVFKFQKIKNRKNLNPEGIYQTQLYIGVLNYFKNHDIIIMKKLYYNK